MQAPQFAACVNPRAHAGAVSMGTMNDVPPLDVNMVVAEAGGEVLDARTMEFVVTFLFE